MKSKFISFIQFFEFGEGLRIPSNVFLLPTGNSITWVIFIVRFPMYVITKSYVLLAISWHAIGCRKSSSFLIGCRKSTFFFFFCDVKEQHTYSAAIETLLVCKH